MNPQQVLETERTVLGTILAEPDVLSRVLGFLKPEDFYDPGLRHVYRTIMGLASGGKRVGFQLVINQLANSTEVSSEELASLFDYQVAADEAIALAGQLSEFSGFRIFSRELDKVNSEMLERRVSLNDAVSRVAATLVLVNSKGSSSKYVRGRELSSEYMGMLSRQKADVALLGLHEIDNHLVDFDSKEVTYVAGRPGTGKEQPLTAKILTPTGWVQNGELQVGDLVIGEDGNSYPVVGIYPQGVKDEYLVKFSDNTEVACGIEHLWVTKSRRERKSTRNHRTGTTIRQYNSRPFTVKTTEEIMHSVRVTTVKDHRLNHSVPYVKPVEFHEQELLIEPYTLGIFLGDGSSSSGRHANPGVTTADQEVIEFLSHNYAGKVIPSRGNRCGGFRFHAASGFPAALSSLGLAGLRSWEKHIPQQYLYASIEQRVALLQGLLDSDGYSSVGASIEYSTTAPGLRDGVMELTRGLGGRATVSSRIGHYIKDGKKIVTRENYRVKLSFPPGVVPFRLQRHLNRFKPRNRLPDKYITGVVKTGRQVEMQCIMIDSPTHLYVTDGYNVTHNTAALLQSVRINLEHGKRVGFLSMEMSRTKVLNRLLAATLRVSGTDLLRMSPEVFNSDPTRPEALDKLVSAPLIIDDTGPFTSDTVPKKIRQLVYNHGCDVVYVDYIGLIGAAGELMKAQRNMQLTQISSDLKSLATELDIPICAAAQLNRDVTRRMSGKPTIADLRDSGSLEQDASLVILLYEDTEKLLNNPMTRGSDTHREEDVYLTVDVAKQRNGSVFTEQVIFRKRFGIFESVREAHSTY